METSSRDRLEMLAASISGDTRLAVDGCEIRRLGVSYTIDTLQDIICRYNPDGKPGLIIGDDLAADFPKWNKSDEILEIADVIIARRLHSGCPEITYPHIQIANDVIEISSGLVREKIAANAAWRYLVPAAARTIIEDRQLYNFNSGADCNESMQSVEYSNSLICRIEGVVRENLSLERFLHSRNTALMAWDLCMRFRTVYPSLDPELGYLAGISHDLAKRLNDKEQIRLAKKYGGGISVLEKEKPSLLHGRASAVMISERFNIKNKDVLEAVALHTGGSRNMGPLAKVVYIADKMEVSREKADPNIRKLILTGNDLDKIFMAVLEQTVSTLRSRKLKLSNETLKLLEKMNGRKPE
jgi:nicotinate-nucleotide adenylyltransferase